MKWVELPMISGYVFVRPNVSQRDLILQQSAVLNYVRYNKKDAVVRKIEIDALKSIQEKGYFVEASSEVVRVGDDVVIGYGPFKGLKGIVSNGHSDEVFTIIINSLDIALKIKVPKEILIKEVKL